MVLRSLKDIADTNKEFNSIGNDQVIFYIIAAEEMRWGLFAKDEMEFGNFTVTSGIHFESFETKQGDTSTNPS